MTRKSEAALAWITRVNASREIEYLTQWNSGWNAYSLIGGHVETGESFRQCCSREIEGELLCMTSDYELAPYPYATLRFREFSKAAREESDFHWQVFLAHPSSDLLTGLPEDCLWVQAHHIRSGRTIDGKPIAVQVRRVLKAVDEAEFDLFVSYGHADDRDGSVTALVEHIRREHEQFVPTEPMKIFFDIWGVRDGDDWQRRIYKGLIESKSMLAVLSPAYFNSQWCRLEYDTFVEQQLKKQYPVEAIQAVYIQSYTDFDATSDHPQRVWFEDLKRCQFTDAKTWWPDGQQALRRDVVSERLAELRQTIWNRVCDAKAIQHSPSNLRDFNRNFIGRENELTQLWNTLRLDHTVAVLAIQGVGGLGKTALARAYTHSRRREYPGGQFEIAMEKITTLAELRFEIIHLANLYLGAGIPDELINSNLDLAFAKAKAAFERPGQGRILLILDNVATNGVLTNRSGSLPSSEYVHVLATTRLDPAIWGIPSLRLESLSTADALDLFQKYRPFQSPEDESLWHRVRNGQQDVVENEVDSDEWKAVVGIVSRLGGHALAIEVVAVYLGNNRTITLWNYLRGLISKGLALKLEQAGDDPKVRARLLEAIETNISELLRPTLEKLEQQCPLAMRALEWAALMPPDHVPWSWLRELIEQEHAEKLLHDADDPDPWQDGIVAWLEGWRLLSSDANRDVARIHRILQIAIVNTKIQSHSIARRFEQLFLFIRKRVILMTQHWGKQGVSWELRPLSEFAKHYLDKGDPRSLDLSHLLAQPLRNDGLVLQSLQMLTTAKHVALECAKRQRNEHNSGTLSVIYADLAEIYECIGNYSVAAEFFAKAIRIGKRLQRKSPANRGLSFNLGKFLCGLGSANFKLENVAKSKECYTEAISVVEQDIRCNKACVPFVSLLKECHFGLGDMYRDLEKIDETVEHYEKVRNIVEWLCLQEPDNDSHRLGQSIILDRLGDLRRACGEREAAMLNYQESSKVKSELLARFPENLDYAIAVSVSCERIGDFKLELGLFDEAHKFYAQSLEFRLQISEKSNQDIMRQRSLSVAYEKIGILTLIQENPDGAIKYFEDAIRIREDIRSIVDNESSNSRDLWMVYQLMAGAMEKKNAMSEANRCWRKVRDIIAELQLKGTATPTDIAMIRSVEARLSHTLM